MLTRLLTPLLVALMVLTSASLAVARAAPDATGQMVLCTGTGPVVVHVDANGDPTGAPHYCPDCAMTLLAAIAGDVSGTVAACGVQQITFEMTDALGVMVPRRVAQARDPPLT